MMDLSIEEPVARPDSGGMARGAAPQRDPRASSGLVRLPRAVAAIGQFLAAGSLARWVTAVVLLGVALPWFFSCPALRPDAEGRAQRERYWAGIVQRKIDNPSHDYTREHPDESNIAKRNFRILVPLLARTMRLGFTGVHVVRIGLQLLLMVALALAAERACRDRLAATGVALAVSGTHIGTAVWHDAFYWFDNCAQAFVALAMVVRSPWYAGIAVVLGLFVDERVLCALPLVLLYHVVVGTRRWLWAGLGAGALAYVALRWWLSVRCGLQNPLGGVANAAVVVPNLANMPAAFWFALEGGWILGAVAMLTAGSRQHIAGFAVFTGAVLVAAGLVGDFTRSTMYVFPATIVAAAIAARSPAMPAPRLRAWAAVAAATSLVVPNAHVIWDRVSFEASLPVRALQLWLQAP